MALHSIVSNHQKSLELNERTNRRNNIIISGQSENEGENTRQVVFDLVQNTLKGVTSSINKIVRLGKPKQNTNRPIMVYFNSFEEKIAIMKTKTSLKGTRIFLHDDCFEYR